MEPATGASTWALGSQRWVKYIGIFTRNAPIRNSDQMIAVGLDIRGKKIKRVNLRCPFVENKNIIVIRNGKEAVIVYNRRYIPAWRRSG